MPTPTPFFIVKAVKNPASTTLALCLLLVLLPAGGCFWTRPGDVDAVQPVSNLQRAGNVYILRGFMGILSPGLDELGQKCQSDGVRAVVYEDDQWQDLAGRLIARYRPDPRPEPLILIGHSFGADNAILIARQLAGTGISVDLLITLDPVLPENIPANVRRAINYYCPNGITDALPVFRGIAVQPDPDAPPPTNIDLRMTNPALADEINHFNIGENSQMQAEMIQLVLDTCPLKTDWLFKQPQPTTRPTSLTFCPN